MLDTDPSINRNRLILLKACREGNFEIVYSLVVCFHVQIEEEMIRTARKYIKIDLMKTLVLNKEGRLLNTFVNNKKIHRNSRIFRI